MDREAPAAVRLRFHPSRPNPSVEIWWWGENSDGIPIMNEYMVVAPFDPMELEDALRSQHFVYILAEKGTIDES